MKKAEAGKIAKIEGKMKQLKAQMIAEKNRLDAKAKKEELRRRILVGAYFLDKAEKEGTLESLAKTIEPFLTRENDRELFGLPAQAAKGS
jgi:hypothetical protein